MTYLYDTDHISILQRPAGTAYQALTARMALHPATAFAASIVSFDEQTVGAHAYLHRTKTPAAVILGYALHERVLAFYRDVQVVPYDAAAAATLAQLQGQGVRIATNDLRIAAIALSRNLTLLTRNAVHFRQVPGLSIEDWTV